MKNHLSKEAYFWLEYICFLTQKHHKLFGPVWWYSLVHEKNIFKSTSFHNFFKVNFPDNKWIRIKATLGGVKKYLSFMYRYLNAPRRDTNFKWRLLVSYGESHLKRFEDAGEALIVAIPTKNNYKRLMVDDKYRLIDEWLTLKDFFIVAVRYFQTLFTFIFKTSFLVPEDYPGKHKLTVKFLLECIKEDWWRSFAGDVLVEGLFFERMFKDLEKQGRGKISEVIYCYEGLGWEKMLCLAFKNYNKRGSLQSAVGQNTLQYYYLPDELKIMPRPDEIDVCGSVSFEVMSEFYGKNNILAIGDLRGNVKDFLTNFKKDDIIKEKTVAILGPVKEMNDELIEWTKQNREDFMVKRHMDDKTDYGYKVMKDFYSELNNIKEVISYSSTLAIEAAAIGIKVVIPELPSFMNLGLIGLGENLNKHFLGCVL